ncbi:hypothetical protein JOC83_001056, partial [Bacillus iocasae]
MKKGIVMEVTSDYVTLLTPEGEFVKTRNEHKQYELGEEMSFFPFHVQEIEATRLASKRKAWKPLFIGTLTVAMMLVFIIPYYTQQQVYAYMSIDINPSLELSVNQDYEVIKIQAFNEEGKELIQRLSAWKHQSLHDVTTNLLKESQKQGYLKETNKVFITTVVKDKKNEKYKQHLSTEIQQVKHEWKSYTFETVRSSNDTREKAVKQGISTGSFVKENETPLSQSKENDQVENESPKPITPSVQPIPFQEQLNEEKLTNSSAAYAKRMEKNLEGFPLDEKPKDESVRAKLNKEKSKDSSVRAKPNQEKSKDESVRTKPNKEKSKDESVRTKPNKEKSKDESVRAKPNQEKPKDESVRAKPNKEKPKDSSVRAKPNKEKPKDSSVRAKPNQEKSKDESVRAKPNQEKSKDSSLRAKPNEEKPKDSSLRAKLNKEKPKDESVRAKPNQEKSKDESVRAKPNQEKSKDSSLR